MAKKKLKNFYLLLSNKRILYRKTKIKTDTRDYLITIPGISVAKQELTNVYLTSMTELNPPKGFNSVNSL